jgi:hypothetical protein
MFQFNDVYQIRPKSFAEIEDIAKLLCNRTVEQPTSIR